ncbi:MAG: adenylate/guanylate cyclase domain-containing protein, partial [Burkholderiales bacterium]
LMQQDERVTLRSLTECRSLFAENVTGAGGRIVNAPGDSVLAEFASVVHAMQCALDIQQALAQRNSGRPESQCMQFRIGVNLGDVLVDASAIYGDGVNVAARLENLAEPGSICVSRSVRDQVLGKLKVSFEDLGEQQVKNIARPVRVYRARPEALAPAPTMAAQPSGRPPLSIVVLAFNNLSGDPEQEYLADGITDDLTTDLSRIAGSFVISRNSAFTYKGKAVDVKQVGRELGVQYALEGSVRRAGNQVRVNAQLIETETGAHVWADRFDRELGDMLALQDDITGSIARVLRYELIEAESRRSLRERPGNPQAIDCLLRAAATVLRTPTPTRENLHAARKLYEEALRLDPGLLGALAGLAGNLINEVNSQWAEEPSATLARAEDLIAQAEAIAPTDPRVLGVRGGLLLQRRKPELALPCFEAAHARDPNSTGILNSVGWCKIFLGDPEASISYVERALRLDPRGFLRGNMYGILGVAHLYLGKLDEAMRYLKLCCDEHRLLAFPRFALASACALAGQLDEARAALEEFRSMRTGVGITQLRAEALSQHPRYLELRERLYEGLRLAGMED